MIDVTLGQFQASETNKTQKTHFCEYRMIDAERKPRCLAHISESRVLCCPYETSDILISDKGAPYIRECPDFEPRNVIP